MIRCVTLGSVLFFLMTASAADLFAQGSDPRVRRAYREKAVAIVGADAREFVETEGDEAVAAIFACSRRMAVKLAEFYTSGEMDKLPRPRDLLRVIALPHHGDDVARWAIQHASELSDTDCFDAYLASPLDYALGLKDLETGAAEARARRLSQAAMTKPATTLSPENERLAIMVGLGLIAIVGIAIWKRKQSSMC
jgi:hypothetical protein